jgi:flagellar hook-length control protein FliK
VAEGPGALTAAGPSAIGSQAADAGGTVPFEARVDAALQSPEFAPMFGARIATLARDGIEQARIALNPAEMGPVSVQLELSGTQVRVELAAEIEATRVALEQALPALAGSLREAGFTLAGGGVFQQARGDASGQGGEGRGAAGGFAMAGDQRGFAVDGNPAARTGGRAPQGLVDVYA